MDYKVVKKDAFMIVGKAIRLTTKNDEHFKRIPQLWLECEENGDCEKFSSLAGELGMLGVSMEFSQEQDEFTYLIGIQKPQELLSEGLVEKQIPASTWAVFESVGPIPDAIQDTLGRIFSEWFPATGYEHAGTPILEVYPPGDPRSPDYRCEVWMPVIKE